MTSEPVTNPIRSIARFNRACAAVALVWIGAALFLTLHWSPNEFKDQETPELHDYSQFYMGGLIARHKAWDSLYPIPKPGSLNSPGDWKYSDTRPDYRALADEAGVPEHSSRFIQPPPFALMMEPFAFLKYRDAKRAWKLFTVLCAWGVAMMGGRAYELATGRPSRLAGVIMLVAAVSPLTLGSLQLMNVSPLIAMFVGLAVLGLATGRAEGSAVALVVGATAKYATAPLLPLYVAMRKRRAVVVMVVTSVVVVGGTVAVMGPGPFKAFIHEQMPTFGRPYTAYYNRSLPALLTQIANGGPTFDPPLHGLWSLSCRAAQWGTLLALLGLLFTRKSAAWREPVNVMAGAAALLSWFLIFSPILWDHYFLYLVPVWGWLAWEARQSIARALLVAFVILFQCLPESIKERPLPGGLTLNGQRIDFLGPYECAMLLTVAGIGLIAMARLTSPKTTKEQ